MHLGQKISGVELTFLSAWRCGYVVVVLIFAPQVYANLHPWRTPEELLALLRRELYMECTLGEEG